MKEGPYNWFPPSYTYSLNCSGSTGANPCTSGSFVNRGGAWGFETEASPGSTVPTLDSLNRFMPPAAQQQMVTSPNLRLFNSGTRWPGQRHELRVLPAHRRRRRRRSAAATAPGRRRRSPARRTRRARPACSQQPEHQGLRQEGPGAQLRVGAGAVRVLHRPLHADGLAVHRLVYWMMNKPMPSLLWNLYNHDYDQAGPYFGAKKANTPLHVVLLVRGAGERPGQPDGQRRPT